MRVPIERIVGPIDVVFTERKRHASDLAREAALAGRETVVAVGGDGSIHEVVSGLMEARAQAAQPPGWAAIFVKAFALVAKEQPILRTLYVKWPMPAFYELPRSVAMVAIARVEDGQDFVLPQKVAAPD